MPFDSKHSTRRGGLRRCVFGPALTALLGITACSGSSSVGGGPDAGGLRIDAGDRGRDAGGLGIDAGDRGLDAGGLGTDAEGDGSPLGGDAATGSDSGDAGGPADASVGSMDGGDGGGNVPPSCAAAGAGLTECTAANESCCASDLVASGTFFRTYTNTGTGPSGESDPAAITAFRLDKYPVTVGRFRRFVAAWNGGAGWSPAAGSGKHMHLNGGRGLTNSASPGTYEPGWNTADNGSISPTTANLTSACSAPAYATWTSSVGPQEELPINCVNWFEAYAFCIWDGGFLPSEAEQEYAAAAGSEQREYPWGSTPPGTQNQYAIYGCYYPPGAGTCSGVANIAPVGTANAGAGLWGQLDLAGSVYEWSLDWYAAYAPCADCAYLTQTTSRTGRGGFYNNSTQYLPPNYRIYGMPTYRGHGNGFRCARAPL